MLPWDVLYQHTTWRSIFPSWFSYFKLKDPEFHWFRGRRASIGHLFGPSNSGQWRLRYFRYGCFQKIEVPQNGCFGMENKPHKFLEEIWGGKKTPIFWKHPYPPILNMNTSPHEAGLSSSCALGCDVTRPWLFGGVGDMGGHGCLEECLGRCIHSVLVFRTLF